MTKRTEANDTIAHRGYLIRTLRDGSVIVTKDGHVICRPNDIDDAKRQIATILD